jgi:hypothetical protein
MSERFKTEFKFDDNDLQANREGKLSDRQIQTFKKKIRSNYWIIIISPIAFWIILLIILPFTFFLDGSPVLPAAIGAFILGVIILAGMRNSIRNIRKDMDSGKVLNHSFIPADDVRQTKSTYTLKAPDGDLIFNNRQYNLFKKKSRYIVYFTASGKNILALESIDDKRNS